MANILLSCAETARKLSDAQEHPLSLPTRLKVLAHLGFCRRYQRQLRFLRRTMHQYREELPNATNATLSSEAKRRIRDTLTKHSE